MHLLPYRLIMTLVLWNQSEDGLRGKIPIQIVDAWTITLLLTSPEICGIHRKSLAEDVCLSRLPLNSSIICFSR